MTIVREGTKDNSLTTFNPLDYLGGVTRYCSTDSGMRIDPDGAWLHILELPVTNWGILLQAADAYIDDLESHEGAEGFSDSTRRLGRRYLEAQRLVKRPVLTTDKQLSSEAINRILEGALPINAALRAMKAERENISDKLELERALTDGAHRRAEAAEAKLAEVEKERDSAKEIGITAIEVAEAHIATLTAQVKAMRLSAMKAMTIANGALDLTATEKTFRRDLVQIREELRGALWPAALTTEKNDG